MTSWTERLRSATVTAFSIKCISSKVVSAEPEYISRKGFISLFLARPAATPSQWRRYEWADSRSPPHGRKRLSYPVGGRGWREREKVAASLAALPTTNHQVSFLLLQSVAAYWTFPSEVEKKLSQLQKNPIVFLSSFFFFFSSVNFNLRPWREKLLLRSFFFLFCKESLDSQTFCVRAIVLIIVDKKAAYISRLRSSVWVGFSAQVSVMRCIFGATWQTAWKDNIFFIVNFIMYALFLSSTQIPALKKTTMF